MTPLSSSQKSLRDANEDANHERNSSAQVSPLSSTPVIEGVGLGNEDYAKAPELSREELNKNLGNCRIRPRPDREVRAMMSMSNLFTPLSTPDADTLIYIGPPPQSPAQSKTNYQYIEQVFSIPHRIHSRTLRGLGSSAFDRLLGPKSERARRRFGKEGLLASVKTEGIKYYIDLRPAEEGDEAVELITDLTCTQGILNWYKAKTKYSIAPTTICGRDDFVSPLDQFRDAELKKEDDANETETPVMPEAEYSALRHRSAIERVLQAIGHNDPKLDSAPKMWTYFQVAKHLDVAKHERVSGWITKWLYSHPNSNFVQSNPEVVYRIGMGIMSTNMIWDAYSMLAGEKALLDTSDPSLRLNSGKSVHGRPLEILDDDERNRIDHAAASLHARVKLRFEHLIDENMDWLKQSNEYGNLMALEAKNDADREAISITDKMIKEYVRGRILWVLGRNYLSDHFEFDQAKASCRDFREGLPMYFNEVYGRLNEAQRLLTRTLWIALQTEKIEEGECNAYTPAQGSTGVLHLQPQNALNYKYWPIGDDMIAREDNKPGTGVKIMTYDDLSINIDKVNMISARHLSEDKKSSLYVTKEKFDDQVLSSPPRAKFFGMLDPQIESSTAQGKHDLIEFDSEDDSPLEMTNRVRPRSGSEKRRRLSADDETSSENHPQTSTLPLRLRNPDLANGEVAASRAEHDNDEVSQSGQLAFVRGQNNILSTRLVPPSSQESDGFYEPGKISWDAQKLAYDTHARSVAEETKAASWNSFDGDVYIRAEPSSHAKQNAEAPDIDHIWVATPTPFNLWETTIVPSSGCSSTGKKKKPWSWSERKPQSTEQGSATNDEKKYWRATTCQLFCELPDSSINLVREDFAAIPTLLEASSRILDHTHLQNYILAYDTYARHLAEILCIPYWTALSGDMYLRSPPKTMSGNANIWNLASTVFNNSANIDVRNEGRIKVEYWRSPAGHLFRRRAGRIELYTEGKEEAPPPSAASILAAPLKMVTKYGTHKIAPHARFVSTPYFDPKRSLQPQSPLRRSVSRSPSHPQTAPVGIATVSYTCIHLRQMLIEFTNTLWKLCEDILHPPHIYHGADPIPRDLMDTLMCLTDEEWKYLPLWAGGCDDGTGGVFDEVDVPNLEAGGFAGGKRGLENDAVDGKGESDGWSEVGSEAISTVGKASKVATDGTETVKSFDSRSDGAFMRQDEVFEMIQNMNVAREKSAVGRKEDEDQLTVMGAASDIQGELFGDIDDDKEVGGMEGDDDDGFELVDGDEGAFVPVDKD